MLLSSLVRHPRPRGRPVQSFGPGLSLRKFLKLRAESMTEVQLQQKIDIQLDPDTDVLTRITGYDLRDALKRTTHLAKEDDIIFY